MSADPIIFYIVRKNADETEGRGPMVNEIGFTSESLADMYISDRSKDWASRDVVKMEVYDRPYTTEDVQAAQRAALMKKAWQHFSVEELAMLGVQGL